jgi:hypothetical protein
MSDYLNNFRIVRQKLNGHPMAHGVQCTACETVVMDLEPGDTLPLIIQTALLHWHDCEALA